MRSNPGKRGQTAALEGVRKVSLPLSDSIPWSDSGVRTEAGRSQSPFSGGYYEGEKTS